MNKELLEALEQVEKEKNISKETLLEAIENSLLTACKNHFGKADNVKVTINPDTGDFAVYAEKEVVEKMDPEENDPLLQISLAEAKMMDPKCQVGDIVHVPIKSKEKGSLQRVLQHGERSHDRHGDPVPGTEYQHQPGPCGRHFK